MNVLIWISIGLFIGWLIATFVKHSTSTLIDIIFGLLGSFFGAFVANTVFKLSVSSIYAFLLAVVGAIVFIFLGRVRAISK